jgi:hypothetical protein
MKILSYNWGAPLDIIHACMYLTWVLPAAQVLFAIPKSPLLFCDPARWLEQRMQEPPAGPEELSGSACDTNGFVASFWFWVYSP